MTTRADVVVIGAGVAGLSAAVRLADAGRRVVVVEQAPRLGGRATAFEDKASGERVDNGQHVLFGCYRETFDFLRRLGTDDLAPPASRLVLDMAGPDGMARLQCPPMPPPFHLPYALLTWKPLRFRDRLASLRLAGLLRDVRKRGAAAAAGDVPGTMTVADWLASRGQTARLNAWLWHPLAYAALNQAPDVAAARPFVRVLGELFGPAIDAAAVALPLVPLDELYAAPAQAAIEAAGGEVRLRAQAHVELDAAGSVGGVRAGDELIETKDVVCSVPWHAFGRIWGDRVPTPLASIAAAANATTSSPIVTVNLWLDAPAMRETFVGLVGGPMHWVFNKSAIYGDDTAHLSVVASGASELAAADNEEITARAMAQLTSLLPGMKGRRLRRSIVVREHRATFSLAPGAPARPGVVTPLPGFVLAGDWTDTGLPGTIEGAAWSGRRAAEAVLK